MKKFIVLILLPFLLMASICFSDDITSNSDEIDNLEQIAESETDINSESGLNEAIASVTKALEKNKENKGLQNALSHLIANKERQRIRKSNEIHANEDDDLILPEETEISENDEEVASQIKLTGLDQAIASVNAALQKNPENKGLQNALSHLEANKLKHELRNKESVSETIVLENIEKIEKMEKIHKPEKADKPEKPEKIEKPSKPEKPNKPERPTKPEKPSKSK